MLLLAYLLSANPSWAIEIPKECMDMDIFVTADLAKINQCVTMLLKQNPKIAEEFQGIHHTIKAIAEMVGKVDPTKAGAFTALALSLYLAAQAFELCSIKLPQHLENVKEYRMELGILYRHKIVPVLKDIHDFLEHCQEYQIDRATSSLLATVREIKEELDDFLRKIEIEKLKVKENKERSGVKGLALIAVSTGSAFVFLGPAGGVMAVGSWAILCIVASKYKMSDFDRLEKQLEKLQDDTNEYKEQITIGESKVRSILMKSYRTVRPPSNRG